MFQFRLHELMHESVGENEDALMKLLKDEYIKHILARDSLCLPADPASCDEKIVQPCASEELLDSGGCRVASLEHARLLDERRKNALVRKLAQSDANKYASAVIKPKDKSMSSTSHDVDSSDCSTNFGQLYYKSGVASHPPLTSIRMKPYIIAHCVDNSGVWCSRGFFRSLSALSPSIQNQYEAA
ncbi:Chromatin remodeling complex WSTF-ISWI, small subunit [Plasmopara halstedii]|uniref:Chromatin remodeling complex WSTF-ISWI, small subunit n=1 Tax=Plasmopara halstedii TaxID=4781 RepID=A0A0P1A8C1_PLAHL|nr:Chromatin remodeling complex WSTF-ISWI, small subunit [Plasmopara halstedii]CEG36453.1 Chromatin remodeling complex WSTF-ISWI, small subunit [Plasmopara halstedii]|eukprot:XP_024572822.1 Chromatin remodeling complex WSTF-ISWI, small subunit [Plasmopara halstedii]